MRWIAVFATVVALAATRVLLSLTLIVTPAAAATRLSARPRTVDADSVSDVTRLAAENSEEAASAMPRRWLVTEILLVFALSLGASGVRAAIDLIADATSGVSLTSQTATVVGNPANGRPWLSLFLLLDSLAFGVVPVLLVIHFLTRSGERAATVGVDLSRPKSDVAKGAILAALVGGAGLGLYLGSHAAGVDLTVVPESIPAVWYRIPILALSALQNAAVEEVLVAGYLLHRLRQLGWGENTALVTSALLRGSYHLYQGLGGFAGNAVMGLIFGRLYQRWGRVMPLLIAHFLMDAVAFIGYAELAHRVSWIPVPK